MPTFSYFGQPVTIDYLYSYARVSSPQQLIENGGEGIGRQLDQHHAFAREFDITVDADAEMTDLAKSGSTGKNIEGGALGGFMDKLLAGKLKGKHPGLTVESFSRLSRLPIDEAMRLFLDLIGRNGVTLITLQDHRVYTQKAIRADQGLIYLVTSQMQAARSHAEFIGYCSTEAWQRYRRGSVSNVIPSWIMKTADGERIASVVGLKKTDAKLALKLDPAKLPVVHRFCLMALDMGVDTIARKLNAEGVPTLNTRKRKRGIELWDKGSLLKILRGRQLLGQQEVAHYVDGKRKVIPGEYIQAYEAAISEELWLRIQAKLDSRQRGIGTGRNVTAMTNLFGDLARCQCGERMKVYRRGDSGQYAYLGCSAAYVGGCDNKRFFRLDQMEAAILPRVANEVIDDRPQVDPTNVLAKQHAAAKAEAAKIAEAYARTMLRSGELAERTAAKLERDHADKLAMVTTLERELAILHAAKPAGEQQRAVRSVLDKALAGDVAARRRIADALPGLVKRIACHSAGWLRVQFAWNTRTGATATWNLKMVQPFQRVRDPVNVNPRPSAARPAAISQRSRARRRDVG